MNRVSIIGFGRFGTMLHQLLIKGFEVDVYDIEPLPQDHKLRFLPNVLLLPHIGFVTAENYTKYYTQMIENLEACASGKPIREIK